MSANEYVAVWTNGEWEQVFEDARRAADGPAVLVVRDAKTGARHEVADPRLAAAEVEAVQAEVFHVLGWQ